MGPGSPRLSLHCRKGTYAHAMGTPAQALAICSTPIRVAAQLVAHGNARHPPHAYDSLVPTVAVNPRWSDAKPAPFFIGTLSVKIRCAFSARSELRENSRKSMQ